MLFCLHFPLPRLHSRPVSLEKILNLLNLWKWRNLFTAFMLSWWFTVIVVAQSRKFSFFITSFCEERMENKKKIDGEGFWWQIFASFILFIEIIIQSGCKCQKMEWEKDEVRWIFFWIYERNFLEVFFVQHGAKNFLQVKNSSIVFITICEMNSSLSLNVIHCDVI